MNDTKATSARDNLAYAAKRFQSETANHVMEIRHDDGLYRHLFFRAAKGYSYWFEIITWPGNLTINGDMGTYTFARVQDMFEFFRAESNYNGTINPGYWGEKIRGSKDEVRAFSEELLVQAVKEHFVEAVKSGDAPAGLGKAIREEILNDFDGMLRFEYEARQIVDSFEYKGFRFVDTWEWRLHDYTIFFLWCCHAIQWGIGQYDAAKKAAVPAGAVA